MGRKPDGLVFTAPEGGPVQLNVWRRRFWIPALHKAGLEHLRPHDLRHTVVALWIAAGANPKEVATQAGHSSVSFTLDRYGDLLPGSEQRLNDALDELADAAGDRTASETNRQFTAKSRTRPRWNRVWREAAYSEHDDAQDADQEIVGGRCGTRTHDLSRVNPFLYRE